MIIKTESIIKDALKLDYKITEKDINCIMYYYLTDNKYFAYTINFKTGKEAERTLQNKVTYYFKMDKIKWLVNYMSFLVIDIFSEYLTNNIEKYHNVIANSKYTNINENHNKQNDNIDFFDEEQIKELDPDFIKKQLAINVMKTIKKNDDASVKLNSELLIKYDDKFTTKRESDDNIVQVEQKYNTVCPNCGKEFAGKV